MLLVCGGGNSVICKKKSPVTEEMSGIDEDNFHRQLCEGVGILEAGDDIRKCKSLGKGRALVGGESGTATGRVSGV